MGHGIFWPFARPGTRFGHGEVHNVVDNAPMTVGELHRFPVKSMRGERLDSCHLGASGLVGDRAYALVDDADGRVASAKNPRKWAGLLDCAARFVDEPAPGEPTPPAVIELPDGSATRTDDPDCHALLSKLLGRSVRVVEAADSGSGNTFEEMWPDIEGLAPDEFITSTTVEHEESGEPVSAIPVGLMAPAGTFFDLSVIHLLTAPTLRHLSGQDAEATFDTRRYRPNVLVEAPGDELLENAWVGQRVALGPDAAITVSLPTMRCVMTTLAQEELPRDRRTLQVIARTNRLEIPGLGTWACAGVYADLAQEGTVRVGDTVTVG